ncbi:hypothetical protein [Halalkalicoccus salilacus]|uniref:hypothetical protein n=1 Tax=Halalkalicoccus sp. GCM10025704 TaxID=3252662 RepID=UPI0036182811
MNSPQNRRRFLATLGLGTATLAGCMDALGSADSDENDGEPSGNETDEDENGSGNEDGNGNREIVAPAIEAGELVDDFEEIEWNPMYDHTTVSSDDECLVGESSMLVESESRDVAGVFRAFSEGQDFFGKDLSFAVRVESPLPARVVLDVRAPGASDRLVSARSIPGSSTAGCGSRVATPESGANPTSETSRSFGSTSSPAATPRGRSASGSTTSGRPNGRIKVRWSSRSTTASRASTPLRCRCSRSAAGPASPRSFRTR